MSLPHGYEARKAIPLYDFLTQYFPDALVELTKVSVEGNKQHNPGEPLHWARGKSMDQLNTAMRHLFDHGGGATFDEDGCMHLAKAAWRLLAEIQLLVEKRQKDTADFKRAAEFKVTAVGIIEPDTDDLPENTPKRAGGGPGPFESFAIQLPRCDLSPISAPARHCYCNTCVRVRQEAATKV